MPKALAFETAQGVWNIWSNGTIKIACFYIFWKFWGAYCKYYVFGGYFIVFCIEILWTSVMRWSFRISSISDSGKHCSSGSKMTPLLVFKVI